MQLRHWQARQEKQLKSPLAPKKVKRKKASFKHLRQKLGNA